LSWFNASVVDCGPVYLAYNPYFSACFFSARTVFFSHNKSVNSIFQPTYQHNRTGLPHQTPLSAIICGEGVDFENVVGVGQYSTLIGRCYRRRRRRRAERRVGAYEGAMMSGSADGGYPGIGVTA
jgi:hypothetical protein